MVRDSGHRGGGKTTLVLMLTMAVFGRLAAAAAWSDKEEERRKALFSYLRQGVAVLVWDNIPRGAQITSPAIEKALTSPEISDRVLQESRSETASAATVQIFNGNNIGPKGDMTSRSFRITINVDRPDPENRPFVHPDPLAWTAQNRQKILRCLYTILIYGCQNRPAGQVQKTRFKDWWSLCGWPVELAASLIDQSIDCTALMKASDTRDDEAGAASTMLSTLQAEFGDAAFTAKDIMAILDAGAAIVRYGYRQEGKCRPTIRRVRSAARAAARSADRRDNRQNSQQPPRRPADLHRRLRCCRRPEGILGEAHEPLPRSGPSWRRSEFTLLRGRRRPKLCPPSPPSPPGRRFTGHGGTWGTWGR